MDFAEACRKLIEIDSSPAAGTLEIAKFAEGLCREAGLDVEVQEETLNGLPQANLLARLGPATNDGLLLQTHLDTAEPGNFALWTRTGANPFRATLYQDHLFGLGAAATKLDFLCKLEALRSFRGKTLRLPVTLAGTFGEELGMVGIVKLIRKKKIDARFALVGEPTGLALVHAGKGFAGVEIDIPYSVEEKEFRSRHDRDFGTTTQSRVFSGRAAHSSQPQVGESAISKMIDYLSKLPEGLAIMEIGGGISFNTVPAQAVLEIDMVASLKTSLASRMNRVFRAIREMEHEFRSFPNPDPEFSPPTPTLNIGQIRSFEDSVKISGCVRLPPAVNHETYERWMTVLGSACAEVEAVFRVTDYKRSFRTAQSHEFVQTCQKELAKIGRPVDLRTQAVANEANVLSRFGVTCIVVGPGQGVGNSHAPNERVSMGELEDAVSFYRGVVERVCL